ncbi:hypothetical protein KSP40_PGU002402 [Platanthera guangdongensis]|uniref:Uncharacterized protein n=1 Tax=Platanthera guangdongensis TaxID=2320717 RepID=A0ABR2MCF6_9ASPA
MGRSKMVLPPLRFLKKILQSATYSGWSSVEQLDVGQNRLMCFIPNAVCSLPKPHNFTFSGNFFSDEAPKSGGEGSVG